MIIYKTRRLYICEKFSVTENKIKFIIKSMDVLNHTLKLLIIIRTYLI